MNRKELNREQKVHAIAQWFHLHLPSLPPLVRVPSTPSTLLSIYIRIVSCGKDEKQ